MPTCPDTCPVVRAQILMEQEALRSAAKEQIKDTATKRIQPVNESRLDGSSIRTNAESFKSKSGVQAQQINNNTQQNLSTPGRSPDKRYQRRHIQQDVQSNVENRSARSPGAASSRRLPEEDQLNESSYTDDQGRSGTASDPASRVTYREDEHLDETFYKDVSRSKAAAGGSTRGKRREDEQLTESSYRDYQGRSRIAATTASHTRRREDENVEKYSDREFQATPRTISNEEKEEAGPSSGRSAILQHSSCGPECPLRRYKELMKRRIEEKQRKLDRYLITKGFNYFDNLCTCSVMCLFNQLSNDHFVRSLLQSALLFTVGLKLCSELYAWQIPSRALFY